MPNERVFLIFFGTADFHDGVYELNARKFPSQL